MSPSDGPKEAIGRSALFAYVQAISVVQAQKLDNPRPIDVRKLALDYSLFLLTAIMHLMRTFVEESLCL